MSRRNPAPRGGDKMMIASVACPCSFHLYDWQARVFYARRPNGIAEQVDRSVVPRTCRRSFGRP